LSPSRIAVSEQVPLAAVTVTVVPDTEQPVEDPELKIYAPVPSPPVAVAVPGVPYVTSVGPVTVTAVVWGILIRVTG
jgi:hypothetical protein